MDDPEVGAAIRFPARHPRRRLLRGVAGGAGALVLLAVAGREAARVVRAQDDDDDDDDSGRGRGRSGRDDDDHSDQDGDHSGPGGGGDDDAVAVVGEVPPGSLVVRIVSDDPGGFSPSRLTVDVGQSVTFANAHDDAHTATGSGFDTGIIQPGATATVLLEQPGSFPYACLIHPEMTGAIDVRGPDGVVPRAPAAAAPPPDATTVRIANFAFAPAEVTVPAGGSVAWVNDDAAPHTVTALDGAFDSGILDPGATFAHTFTAPGAFPYRCDLHPAMTGTVVVSGDAAAAPAAGGDTTAEPAAPAPPDAPPAATAAVESVGGDLAGSWLVALTPDSDAIPPQRALLAFRGDGTLDAAFAADASADAAGPRLGPGRGSWEADGERAFRLALAALLLDEAGRFAGTLEVRGSVTLDETGDGYRGAFAFAALGPAGEPLASGAGTSAGERVGVGDLPVIADDRGTPTAPAPDATPPAGPPATPTAETVVTILNFAFDPPTVEIAAGGAIVWRNEDPAPHTATALDGAFDTGRLDQGQEARQVFAAPGRFPYRCSFHPTMEGEVVVSAAPA